MSSIVKLGAAALLLSVTISGSAFAQTGEAKELSPQTKANLETAMHGEAFANLKYQRYADQADEKGQSELAQLFRDSANIEANEHFDREAEALQLGSSSDVNLEDAMAGEHYENTKMYVEFANQAEADGDTKVAAMFRQIAVDEGVHYDAYKAALARLKTK
jgi:rubrerythrin